ncbi:DUF1266 domain-containing protein [Lysobacter terrae]
MFHVIMLIIIVVVLLIRRRYIAPKARAKSEAAAEAEKEAKARERVQRCYRENAPPPDKAPLLGFGALMMARNKEYSALLPLRRDEETIREGMARDWDVIDERSARSTIQQVILLGRRVSYQEDFALLQQGASADKLTIIDADAIVRLEQAKKVWEERGLPPASTMTLAAYDYERIAYLARACHYLKYITEDEAWRVMAWVAVESKRDFADWAEYAASFIFGRAASFAGGVAASDDVEAAWDLLTQVLERLGQPYIWQRYPLADILISAELLAPAKSAIDDAESTSVNALREPLLGLGALTAFRYEESPAELAIAAKQPSANVEWLARSWNVADTASVTARLEWLTKVGSRKDIDTDFGFLIRGGQLTDLQNVGAAHFLAFQKVRLFLQEVGIDAALIAGCQSMLAYDLERAAYLTRVAVATGYLDEEAGWTWLRRIGAQSRHFDTWEAYLVSYVLGQAIFESDPKSLKIWVRLGIGLLKVESPFKDYCSPWRQHSLDRIQVLRAIGPSDGPMAGPFWAHAKNSSID